MTFAKVQYMDLSATETEATISLITQNYYMKQIEKAIAEMKKNANQAFVEINVH